MTCGRKGEKMNKPEYQPEHFHLFDCLITPSCSELRQLKHPNFVNICSGTCSFFIKQLCKVGTAECPTRSASWSAAVILTGSLSMSRADNMNWLSKKQRCLQINIYSRHLKEFDYDLVGMGQWKLSGETISV